MSRTQSIALAAVVAIVAVTGGMLSARWLLQHRAGAQPDAGHGDAARAAAAAAAARVRGPGRPAVRRPSGCAAAGASCSSASPAVRMCARRRWRCWRRREAAGRPARAARPQVVMISVDPRARHARATGHVRQVVRARRSSASPARKPRSTSSRSAWACRSRSGRSTAADYTVDHSAAIFLIDPDGALRALFSAPHDAASSPKTTAASSPLSELMSTPTDRSTGDRWFAALQYVLPKHAAVARDLRGRAQRSRAGQEHVPAHLPARLST